jgi:hypothetical protein
MTQPSPGSAALIGGSFARNAPNRVACLHAPEIRLSPAPRLQALVLADRVYAEQGTGKKVIAGTFNTIAVLQPGPHVNLPAHLYISLTELRKRQFRLELRYVDTRDLTVLMSLQPPPFDNPGQATDTLEMVVEMPPFPAPHEGVYDLELYIDGERLGCHRIIIRTPPQSP